MMRKAITIILILTTCLLLVSCSSKSGPGLMLSKSPQTYYLENPTERDKFERMMYIQLFDDGSARIMQPPISSYILPPCTYSLDGSELLIHAVIKTELDEGFFGLKNNDVIAKFTVIDSKTLVFESATVPLFADTGARYIYDPQMKI